MRRFVVDMWIKEDDGGGRFTLSEYNGPDGPLELTADEKRKLAGLLHAAAERIDGTVTVYGGSRKKRRAVSGSSWPSKD